MEGSLKSLLLSLSVGAACYALGVFMGGWSATKELEKLKAASSLAYEDNNMEFEGPDFKIVSVREIDEAIADLRETEQPNDTQ